MRAVAGVDLGGTACRFVAWADGQVLAAHTLPTVAFADGSGESRLLRMGDAIAAAFPQGVPLAAVGIGASGPIDLARGVIENPDTLPMLTGLPLVSFLVERLGVPVTIDNDAVAAALAEQRIGAGEGAERLLMVTLGTGVGAAFLVGGAPFRGAADMHPEAGHIPIASEGGRCYCGAEGCFEALASRAALQSLLRPLLPHGMPPEDLLPQAMAAAEQGDAAVRAAFARYGTYVGRGLAALHTVWMPQATVLGGSAARCLPWFAGAMEAALARAPGFAVASPVRLAALGDEAGAIGGALMAERMLPRLSPA